MSGSSVWEEHRRNTSQACNKRPDSIQACDCRLQKNSNKRPDSIQACDCKLQNKNCIFQAELNVALCILLPQPLSEPSFNAVFCIIQRSRLQVTRPARHANHSLHALVGADVMLAKRCPICIDVLTCWKTHIIKEVSLSDHWHHIGLWCWQIIRKAQPREQYRTLFVHMVFCAACRPTDAADLVAMRTHACNAHVSGVLCDHVCPCVIALQDGLFKASRGDQTRVPKQTLAPGLAIAGSRGEVVPVEDVPANALLAFPFHAVGHRIGMRAEAIAERLHRWSRPGWLWIHHWWFCCSRSWATRGVQQWT